MNDFNDCPQDITQGACRALAAFRRRLRDHSMTWEDSENLADVLEWVEECLVMTPEEVA